MAAVKGRMARKKEREKYMSTENALAGCNESGREAQAPGDMVVALNAFKALE